ncbi:MAG: glycyl-radical enzyme activating protein [Clostridiales bacterium]
MGIIFNIMKYSIHDGPGIRTTVFLKGCPLHCLWCHNPESMDKEIQVLYEEKLCTNCGLCAGAKANSPIDAPWLDQCPQQALSLCGKDLSPQEILDEVEKDAVFFSESGGGITFSGGEPLLQKDFLQEMLQEAQKRSIDRVVDTCGYAAQDTIEEIFPLVNLWLYDIKCLDKQRHKQLTGLDNQIILDNLLFLAAKKAALRIRLPIIPQFNDQENIQDTIDFLQNLPQKYPVDLLPYHRLGQDKYQKIGAKSALANIDEPNLQYMQNIAKKFKKVGFTVKIGG